MGRLLVDVDYAGVALGAIYQRARWRIVAAQETDAAIDLLEGYLEARVDEELPWAPDRAAALWRLGLAKEQAGYLDAALAAVESRYADRLASIGLTDPGLAFARQEDAAPPDRPAARRRRRGRCRGPDHRGPCGRGAPERGGTAQSDHP